MIPISEAISIIEREALPLAAESILLSKACGRILAEDVFSDSDMPPFRRSQMDGFAVKSGETAAAPARLKIIGESIAGKRWEGSLGQGEAVRIMTGAALPDGADAVQRVEATNEADGLIEILEPVKPGQFYTEKASEVKKGDKLFSRGDAISEKMIASLAAFGYAEVKVSKRPKAAIMATGSELVEISEIPGQDEIRNSNSETLAAFARNYADIEIFPAATDDLDSLKRQIADCEADVLILTGGVSMGDYDFTKPALKSLGAEIFFEKASLRPGKPCVFGRLGDKLIFGLPGNPVSVIVTFLLFARKALLAMQGAKESGLRKGYGILIGPLEGAKERDSYLPGKIEIGKDAKISLIPLKFSGSSNFIGFAGAEVLIFVPKAAFLDSGSIAEIAFIPSHF